jgi:predicted DCC family thiol-disulfide oxidoreductase YuxK
MSTDSSQPIVIFDGVCGVCDRLVALALQNDLLGELVFTANSSEYGSALCESLNVKELSERTIIVVHGEQVLLRSDAVIFIAKHLRAPYNYFAAIRYIPKAVRDLGYRFVASARRAFPLKRKVCDLLPPDLRARIRG